MFPDSNSFDEEDSEWETVCSNKKGSKTPNSAKKSGDSVNSSKKGSKTPNSTKKSNAKVDSAKKESKTPESARKESKNVGAAFHTGSQKYDPKLEVVQYQINL